MTTTQPQPQPDTVEPDASPLDLARVWTGTVLSIARHYEQREREEPGFGKAEARVDGAGRQQFEAAQMASFMALVSIAEDLHRIADRLTGLPGGLGDEWELTGRDGDGNAVLKHRETGGRYRIIPEEDL